MLAYDFKKFINMQYLDFSFNQPYLGSKLARWLFSQEFISAVLFQLSVFGQKFSWCAGFSLFFSALLVLPHHPAVGYDSYMTSNLYPEIARKSSGDDSKRPSLSLSVHPNQFRLAKRITWVPFPPFLPFFVFFFLLYLFVYLFSFFPLSLHLHKQYIVGSF